MRSRQDCEFSLCRRQKSRLLCFWSDARYTKRRVWFDCNGYILCHDAFPLSCGIPRARLRSGAFLKNTCIPRKGGTRIPGGQKALRGFSFSPLTLVPRACLFKCAQRELGTRFGCRRFVRGINQNNFFRSIKLEAAQNYFHLLEFFLTKIQNNLYRWVGRPRRVSVYLRLVF